MLQKKCKQTASNLKQTTFFQEHSVTLAWFDNAQYATRASG